MKAPPAILAKYQLSNPSFIEETHIARIWKVQTASGGWAALKLYHKPDMGAERAGFAVMSALNGVAAAKVLATSKNTALTEWLDGPSLGDLTRNGQDDKATHHLGETAAKMHRHMPHIAADLPNLTQWFQALETLTFAEDCPPHAKHNLQTAQALTRQLLATEQNPRPLHGDLHHDNIRFGPRGYAAFDAKGLIGERCFELANAFRNPKGAEPLHRDPTRIRHLANAWSQSFEVDAQRLLHWAAAKCALSIAWRSGGTAKNDPEFDLLATLLDSHP
ncbi:MAG: phosphotransferase [Rhodobacteraceae bacterium]|nr:phosphotransferase [Paracoccaceae bacterium]